MLLFTLKTGKIFGVSSQKCHINLCCFPWFIFTLCLQQRILCHKPHKNNKNYLFHYTFMCYLSWRLLVNLAPFNVKSHCHAVFFCPCSRFFKWLVWFWGWSFGLTFCHQVKVKLFVSIGVLTCMQKWLKPQLFTKKEG